MGTPVKTGIAMVPQNWKCVVVPAVITEWLGELGQFIVREAFVPKPADWPTNYADCESCARTLPFG